MNQNDVVRLKHMLDAIHEIIFFARDKTKADFYENRQLVLSIIKLIEMIGEAASKISKEVKVKYKNIPWAEIIGMRNRLIHVYFDIDVERVWDTVQMDVPELGYLIERILNNDNL